jgi:hypothetical protein
MLLRSNPFLLIVMFMSLFQSTTAFGQAPSKQPRPSTTAKLPDVTDQEQFVAYWTSETGWKSELQFRNNQVGHDLTVTPVLRTATGAETPLAPVTVRPQEVKSIDIDAAIGTTAPQLVGTYGSVVLRYRSRNYRNLYAALMVRNIGHPFAFHIDAIPESQDYEAGGREGIWWLPKDTTNDYLVLTNQGKDAIPLVLSLYDANGKESKQTLLLGAHETTRYSVRKLVGAAGLTGAYGGIKVSAASHAGSLDTAHVLFDETAGFSAILKMFDHEPNAKLDERDFARTKVWTLRAPMLALSNPDPALAFPLGTTLRPQLFIRNTTDKPVDTALRFNWRSGSSTGKAPGPSVHLNPYETRRVDVAAFQDGATLPKQASWTSVTLTTKGIPDEIMAVATSYDDTLRYGAQTPFSDQLTFKWEGGMWEFDPVHDSIITAGNGGTKPIQAAFTLFYNQGADKYELEQKLQPDEQMWIDVGKIIREHVQDKNGKALPADLTSGSYEFRDLTDTGIGSLFEGKVIYDKTYGHVAYGCASCCGYYPPVVLTFDPFGIPLSDTFLNGVSAYDYCADMMSIVDGNFYYNWGTGDTSIATVDGYGTHTGVGIGSTFSGTSGTLASQGGRSCPLRFHAPSGTGNVVPGFAVGYNAYIPVDHVQGALTCSYSTNSFVPLTYIGDGNRGTFRTAEQIRIVPDLQQSSGFFQDTGQSRSYGWASPFNGSTLSDLDEDGVPLDCYLWNDAAKATPAFSHDESYPSAHQAQAHYAGSASNPLETSQATITWDLHTVLDTTNPQSPTGYVNYNHTCYPAHQIKVNGALIYLYTPPRNDPDYLTGCLLFHIGMVSGQTSSVSVPAH